VPTLLLWGPRDPVFGERYLADLRARLPQAQLHRYEGASHLVTEDAPEYADAVAQWVTDLQADDRTAPRTPETVPGRCPRTWLVARSGRRSRSALTTCHRRWSRWAARR
jgi:hypothetical protein